MAKTSASKKAGAPAVVVDRSGKRVRLRFIDHALPYCVSTEDGEVRGVINPNQWTTVPDEVYEMLKGKFLNAQEFDVPDWEVGPDGGAVGRTPRRESYRDEYIIEFPDEA